MNNNQQPWYYSWWVIILAFIIFWPAGIALLIFRNQNAKKSIFLGTTDRRKYTIAGIILAIIGLSALIDKHILMGLFMILGGAALFYYSGQLAKRSIRNKQYMDMIVNHNVTSIDSICSRVGQSYDKTVTELKQLVAVGVLKNATIDERTHTIKFNKPDPVQMQPQSSIAGAIGAVTDALSGASAPSRPQAAPVEAVCPGCGVRVVLAKGATTTCEYCDATIVGK